MKLREVLEWERSTQQSTGRRESKERAAHGQREERQLKEDGVHHAKLHGRLVKNGNRERSRLLVGMAIVGINASSERKDDDQDRVASQQLTYHRALPS